jgi:hypothetical protein
MKFKLIALFFLLTYCTTYSATNQKVLYNSKGFAYIYSDDDYIDKIINKKFDNTQELIGHDTINNGVLVRITNPITKKSIILKNSSKVKYPDFYKILITEPVVNLIDLNKNIPYVEIQVIKKNKSFVAKKAETFKEEKNISNNAPVEKVQISNIHNTNLKKIKKTSKFIIIIGDFYSEEIARSLKNELSSSLLDLDKKKLNISTNKKNSIRLFSGPYNSLKLLKKDYIELKKYGFEELDVKIYD